jgi:hypothetical protein
MVVRGQGGLPARALYTLTFGRIRSRYPALAAGPLDADLRRGFEIPEQSSPVSGSSFETEGWANGGCSDP